MEKIIVFTNHQGLAAVDEELCMKNEIPLINSNNFIVFKEYERYFQVATSITDGKIFFINDEITEEKLSDFLKEFDKESIGVLKHRKPEFALSGFKKYNSDGIHQSKPQGRFYPEVLQIITGNPENIFSQLQIAIWGIDDAGEEKENKKKQLANNILDTNEIPLNVPKEIKECQSALDKFRNAVNIIAAADRNWNHNNYICLFNQFKRDIGL